MGAVYDDVGELDMICSVPRRNYSDVRAMIIT